MLAFSTCWNTGKHEDGEDIIDEILELGFEWIELSHGMTITKLPGLQRAFKNGKFRCTGLHNFFPSPTEVTMDAPDAYEFTSYREYERDRAYKLSVKTLEMAAEFEAKYVVLHLGSNHQIPSDIGSKPLENLLKKKQFLSPEFTNMRAKFVQKREKTAELYYRRALHYLDLLSERAAELGIMLAVESRSHYEQIPSEREMLDLLARFENHPHVGYWHDFGHVHRKHNLGLLDHEDWLKKCSPHLIGAHLHDVQWPTRDHRVPFQGEIPYEALLPYFPPSLPMVWELSPTRQPEDIRTALREWKQRFPSH